jgi:hypothetical protein
VSDGINVSTMKSMKTMKKKINIKILLHVLHELHGKN